MSSAVYRTIFFYFTKWWNAEYANNFAAHHKWYTTMKKKVEKRIKKTMKVVTQFKQTENELEWVW